MFSAVPRMEISLRALIRNFRTLRRLGRGAFFICTVKADAYGHGAIPCVRTLAAAGAEHFAVSCAQEALALAPFFCKTSIVCKEMFTKSPTLYVFGSVSKEELWQLLPLHVCLSVHSVSYARALNAALSHAKVRAP